MKFLMMIAIFMGTAHAGTLKVMSYNAHNLFDTKHDEGKNDWQYLPKDYPGKKEGCEAMSSSYYRELCLKSDWNQEKYELKLNQLARVINDSQKPDILALCEVENERVVKDLANKLGYNRVVVSNSPDNRGIDVAFAFNENDIVEFVEAREVSVKGTSYLKEKPTRNILEVVLKINGEKISFINNHWPSQGNPTVNRIRAAKTLKKMVNKRAKKDNGIKFVMVGDFNTLKEDFPHPFKSVLLSDYRDERETQKAPSKLKKLARKLFRIPIIQDMHTLYMGQKELTEEGKAKLPRGTYFYPPKMSWNLLDRIFISENILSGKVTADISSYKIETPSFAVVDHEYAEASSYNFGTIIKGVPMKSNHSTLNSSEAGFSDHFPVSFNLKY